MMVLSLIKHRIKRIRAITLFEMTIVVALTMILSLIFMYSTKFIIVKTKVERVKEEHRALSRALQNYRMDYNDYPKSLRCLNAPTAYVSALPMDPFMKQYQRESYVYYHKPSSKYEYIIISVGPNGVFDLEAIIERYLPAGDALDGDDDDSDNYFTREEFLDYILPIYLSEKTYDPTNGIISDGDVVTLSYK